MTTLADYAGRIYDVMAFQGVAPAGINAQLRGALADELTSGTICTGMQKLAQLWLLEFLTESGSVPYDPDAGTNFLRTLSSGEIQTETDVYLAFGFAATRVDRRLRAKELTTTPLDERISTSNLTKVILSPGFLRLQIRILSQAGEDRSVILPLPITP